MTAAPLTLPGAGDRAWHVPAGASFVCPDRLPDGTSAANLSRYGDPTWDLSPLSRRPALVLAPGNPVTGQAALAVAGCCSSGCCASSGITGQDDQDAGLLFAACERVLRPGGLLAVIASPAAPGGTLTDTAGSVTAAARPAGLVYAQHIVLAGPPLTAAASPPPLPAPELTRPAAARCMTTC
jgi:hypothetical protein